MRHLVALRRRVPASRDSSAHRVRTDRRPPTVSREMFVPRESSAHQAPVKVGHVEFVFQFNYIEVNGNKFVLIFIIHW